MNVHYEDNRPILEVTPIDMAIVWSILAELDPEDGWVPECAHVIRKASLAVALAGEGGTLRTVFGWGWGNLP